MSKQEFDLVPLILKVKENPILYDTSEEDYGDPIKTNRAWNCIARELLLPNGTLVRCKWKSICDTYLKSLKGKKKNAAVTESWVEEMKFFKPYLTNEKTSGEENKNDTTTSTPSKKNVPPKRQRSPEEVATGRRFSRSVATVEEELDETDLPMKKARISILEETVESKVTKGTPRKSETLKTPSKRLSRSTLRTVDSHVSINEEESESSSLQESIRKLPNKAVSVSPSKAVPIVITPEMRKGPRRLPRSVLRALEAEASSTTENSQQDYSSSPASGTQSTKADTSLLNQTSESPSAVSIGSRSTKRSQRFSLDPRTTSVCSPLRSTRYSVIPEKPTSREELLQNPITKSARFSTNQRVVTGANPGSFKESIDYFESPMQTSPVRLPRSSVLEEEFARHDAMMESIMETSEDISFQERNNLKLPSAAAGTKENMDATDLLFLSHALTVKSFSERKQMEVKRKISQIITQAELDEMA